MIMDKLSEFCDSTALNTGAAGKYLIGDVINLEAGRDIGSGQTAWLVVQVDTTVTSGGAATLELSLSSDAQAAIAVDGTETTHMTVGTFAIAEMTAGSVLAVIAIPREGKVYEQYIGVVQTTAVAAFTAGAISAFITEDPSVWRAYPDGAN